MNNSDPNPRVDCNVRVAIYARVSSERQSRDGTIESQVAALRARVEQERLVLDPELSFIDDGYSGSTLVRPALERLRDQAAAGVFGRLYVHSPDRLARRYAYQVLLIDELQGCGVEVVFLNRQLAQGPEDDLLLQVQGVVAEYERAKILERSRRGKQHAARRGSVSVLAPHAPYGYRYITREMAGGEARLNVQLDEARVVGEMFRWVALERMSLSEVARRLKEQNIRSPRGRDYWDRSTVFGILRNPCYKGMALFGKRRVVERVPPLRPRRNQPEQSRRTVSCQRALPEQCIEIPVPAIVQADLHDAVQAQLAENRKRHRRASADAQYLLQGLVVCKRCGFAMCGARNGNRLYYRCIGNGATRMTGVHVCQSRSIRGELLEQIVWDDARSLLEEPARVEAEYQRRLNLSAEQGRGPDDQKLRKQLNQARRQIGRLIDAYGDGLIDKAEFEPRIRAARDQVAKLETDIKSQAEQQQQIQELRLVIGHLQAFAERVHNGLDAVTTADRRQILRALIKRIEVDCEEVTIVYRIDCHPFPHAPERGCVQDCRRRPRDAEVPRRCRSNALQLRASPPALEPSAPHDSPA